MKGNQRNITNNLCRNLICLRAAAKEGWVGGGGEGGGGRESGTILGDNSKT